MSSPSPQQDAVRNTLERATAQLNNLVDEVDNLKRNRAAQNQQESILRQERDGLEEEIERLQNRNANLFRELHDTSIDASKTVDNVTNTDESSTAQLKDHETKEGHAKNALKRNQPDSVETEAGTPTSGIDTMMDVILGRQGNGLQSSRSTERQEGVPEPRTAPGSTTSKPAKKAKLDAATRAPVCQSCDQRHIQCDHQSKCSDCLAQGRRCIYNSCRAGRACDDAACTNLHSDQWNPVDVPAWDIVEPRRW